MAKEVGSLLGAIRNPSPITTSLSLAAVATDWPLHITWRRSMARNASQWSKKAGLGLAMPGVIQQLCEVTILCLLIPAFTITVLALWESMERELNFNVMHSQRGVLFLHHNDAERDDHYRKTNIMRMQGTDGEILGPEKLRKMYPSMNFDGRFPITGAYLHRRGGTARHDAVVWGYARSADRRGVDILQNCKVTGFRIEQGKVLGIETTRGFIGANKVGVSVAGNTSRVMDMAGIRTPIESHILQAFVSEGLKPIIPGQVNYGAGHFYISQSDKGGLVLGGDLDQYNSCAQRGNLPVFESVIEAAVTLFPMLSRARLLRAWGGLQDMSMDGHAVIDETPIKGLYLNGGWCYGGFKATPAAGECFAHLLSTEQPHELAKPYRLDRFRTGYLLDEKGQGPNPNRQ